ncbi:MAG: hypothetical protein Q9160_009330 [Pyrenula sp. 1 TL-2023]
MLKIRACRDRIGSSRLSLQNRPDREQSVFNTDLHHEYLHIQINGLNHAYVLDPTGSQYGIFKNFSEADMYENQFVRERVQACGLVRPEKGEEPRRWHDKAVIQGLKAWKSTHNNTSEDLQSFLSEEDDSHYQALEMALLDEIEKHIIQHARDEKALDTESVHRGMEAARKASEALERKNRAAPEEIQGQRPGGNNA